MEQKRNNQDFFSSEVFKQIRARLLTQVSSLPSVLFALKGFSEFDKETCIGVEEAVDQFRYGNKNVLLLEGAPGSGKTTFCFALTKRWLESNSRVCPFYISLMGVPPEALHPAFLNDTLRTQGFTSEQMEELKSSQPCLFFFDGYEHLGKFINLYHTLGLSEWHHAQCIITCRTLYLLPLNGQRGHFFPIKDNKAQPSAYTELSLAPLEFAQAKQYLKVEAHVWNSLALWPGLITNPFFLHQLARQLPLSEVNSKTWLHTVMDAWWDNEAKRMPPCGLDKQTFIPTLQQYTQALAQELLEQSTSTFTYQPQSRLFGGGGQSKSMFNQVKTRPLLTFCPLCKLSSGDYGFIENVLIEYLVNYPLTRSEPLLMASMSPLVTAQPSIQRTSSTPTHLFNHYLNWKFMSQEAEFISLLANRICESQLFKDLLFTMLMASKQDKYMEKAASNAITLLNHAGVSFSGLDLSGVKIPQADLTAAVLDSTNLTASDLRGVNLSQAFLGNANLQKADLREVTFGELPTLTLKDRVSCVTYSRDGCYLAVSAGHTIKLFHDKAGKKIFKEIRELKQHNDLITSIAFSPDGTLLASGSADYTVCLWNIKNHQSPPKIKRYENIVTSVVFSPDGMFLASGSIDKTVCLWDTHTLMCQGKLKKHTHEVHTIAFSSDSNLLASGGADHIVLIWNIKNQQLIAELKGHTNNVASVKFSPDGTLLASGSTDKTVRLWDTKDQQLIAEFKGHTYAVASVAFSPDGTLLASGSADKTVRLWDTKNQKLVAEIKGHTHAVNSVVFSPDGTLLASGTYDQKVHLWNIKNQQPILSIKGHKNAVTSIAFSLDRKLFASGSNDKTVRLWDTNTLICQGELSHKDEVYSISFSPDGTLLVSGSKDGVMYLWDTRTLICYKKLKNHTDAINCIAFSSDGALLASGSYDHTVRLWDARTFICFGELNGHSGSVNSIAFSPNSKLLASGSADYVVRLWDTESQQCIGKVKNENAVKSVAFSPDGMLLALGSYDEIMCLWNMKSREFSGKLKCTNSIFYSVAFSPDGLLLASGGDESTVQLWNTKNHQLVDELKGHTHSILSVVFNPDGKYLASGSEDCALFLWAKTSDEPSPQGKWTLMYRFANSMALLAYQAFFNETKISAENLLLLKQRGAKDQLSFLEIEDKPSKKPRLDSLMYLSQATIFKSSNETDSVDDFNNRKKIPPPLPPFLLNQRQQRTRKIVSKEFTDLAQGKEKESWVFPNIQPKTAMSESSPTP